MIGQEKQSSGAGEPFGRFLRYPKKLGHRFRDLSENSDPMFGVVDCISITFSCGYDCRGLRGISSLFSDSGAGSTEEVALLDVSLFLVSM